MKIPWRRKQVLDHCWHKVDADGKVVWSIQGSGPVRCCRCGKAGQRHWATRSEPAPPHGRFATFQRPALVVADDSPCEPT